MEMQIWVTEVSLIQMQVVWHTEAQCIQGSWHPIHETLPFRIILLPSYNLLISLIYTKFLHLNHTRIEWQIFKLLQKANKCAVNNVLMLLEKKKSRVSTRKNNSIFPTEGRCIVQQGQRLRNQSFARLHPQTICSLKLHLPTSHLPRLKTPLVPLAKPPPFTSIQPSATVEQQHSSSGQMPWQEVAGEIVTRQT